MQLNSVSFTSTKIKVYNFDVFNDMKKKKINFAKHNAIFNMLKKLKTFLCKNIVINL